MAKKKVAAKKTSTSKKKVEKKVEKEEVVDLVRNTVQVVPYVKRKTIFNTNKK